MKLLRLIPTVKRAKVARAIRAEFEARAEYVVRYGVSAPGQINFSLSGSDRAAVWPPPLSRSS